MIEKRTSARRRRAFSNCLGVLGLPIADEAKLHLGDHAERS
jgi:hypothetical protein